VIVEVESSENCEAGLFARFKEAGPARPVVQVRLYERNPVGEWYWVTGWSDNAERPLCPAYAQRVEAMMIVGMIRTHLLAALSGAVTGLFFHWLWRGRRDRGSDLAALRERFE